MISPQTVSSPLLITVLDQLSNPAKITYVYDNVLVKDQSFLAPVDWNWDSRSYYRYCSITCPCNFQTEFNTKHTDNCILEYCTKVSELEEKVKEESHHWTSTGRRSPFCWLSISRGGF